ncbi:hypothetical protein JCM5353_003663, partial [Sporobolomyces roseus]
MSDSSTTFVPFDLFGTTFDQTINLLTALQKLFLAQSDKDIEDKKAATRKLIDSCTSPKSPQRKFWDEALESVYDWKSGEEVSIEGVFAIDFGLYPFNHFVELADPEYLKSLSSTWWNNNGSASKRKQDFPLKDFTSPERSSKAKSPRRSSRTRSRTPVLPPFAPRRDSKDDEDDEEDGEEEDEDPASDGPSKTPPTSSKKKSAPRSSVDPYEFIGDPSSSQQPPRPS